MNKNEKILKRAHLIGLGALATSALFAVGTFGYTMIHASLGDLVFGENEPALARVADAQLITGAEVESLLPRTWEPRTREQALQVDISPTGSEIVVLQIEPAPPAEPSSVGRSGLGPDSKPKSDASRIAPTARPADLANDRQASTSAIESEAEQAAVGAQSTTIVDEPSDSANGEGVGIPINEPVAESVAEPVAEPAPTTESSVQALGAAISDAAAPNAAASNSADDPNPLPELRTAQPELQPQAGPNGNNRNERRERQDDDNNRRSRAEHRGPSGQGRSGR